MTDTNTDEGDKALVPGSDEYNAAMAAKAQEARSGVTEPFEKALGQDGRGGDEERPQRPENVPEKFWDAEKGEVNTEALLKSYTDLEAARSAPKDNDESDEAASPSDADKAIAEAVKAAGLNMDDISAKLASTGDLEDADYAALAKIGISREFAEQVVDAFAYVREGEVEKAVAYFGGDDAKNELFDWAARNLPPEKVTEYNQLLAGPHWRVAADSLMAARRGSSKTANEPNLRGGRGGGGPAAGYKDQVEMRADMRNPLYQDRGPKGEAFRREVLQKAAASEWHRK